MKNYFGSRYPNKQVAVENIENGSVNPLNIRRDLCDHSNDFEWGYSGSGPAQLSFAILFDLFGNKEIAETLKGSFKNDFVSHFQDDWFIKSDEILQWAKIVIKRITKYDLEAFIIFAIERKYREFINDVSDFVFENQPINENEYLKKTITKIREAEWMADNETLIEFLSRV
jgi:hypothetical protein